MVNDSMKKRKPAQVRYDETHPTISFRLDFSTKARLAEYIRQRKISYADFIKESLGVKVAEEKLAEDRYEQGYEEGCVDGQEYGYRQGEEKTIAGIERTEITPKCPRCGYVFGIYLRDIKRIDADEA